GVIRPIRPGFADSVNHKLPSGPTAMPKDSLFGVNPLLNSVTAPLVVIRPIAPSPPDSVNHRSPSGPVVIIAGALPLGNENSVADPPGVTRAILLTPASVSQRLPSGPVAIPNGAPLNPALNSVICPATVLKERSPRL